VDLPESRFVSAASETPSFPRVHRVVSKNDDTVKSHAQAGGWSYPCSARSGGWAGSDHAFRRRPRNSSSSPSLLILSSMYLW